MFPFDQSALPQLTTRRAFIGVDFQHDFTSEEGALPVLEPSGYVQRAVQLAAAFRKAGDVVWVKTAFDGCRAIDDEQILVTDTAPPANSASARRSRRRPPASVEATVDAVLEAALPTDPEAFLSHDEPSCLRSSDPQSGEWDSQVKLAIQKSDAVLTKTHYSAFKATQLLHILRAKMVMEVFICGSLANVGVFATAMDAAGHGMTITIVEDCCGFRIEKRQMQAVENLMEYTGCEVASMQEVLETIQPAAPKDSKPAHKPSRDAVAQEPVNPASRVTESPDLVQPMTGLRLKSQSPATLVMDSISDVIEPMDAGSENPTEPDVLEATTAHSSATIEQNPAGGEQSPKATEASSDQKGDTQGNDTIEVAATAESDNREDIAGAESSELEDGHASNKCLCEGDTDIIENVLPPEIEEGIFEELREEVQWQRMSHQGGAVPRLVAVQGEVASDGSIPVYRHPSDESPPLLPFSNTVTLIKEATEKQLGHPLNHVLIQYYRDGKDYISEHSDKTLDIVRDSYIANVSLGAERTMVLRTKRLDKDPSHTGKSTPSEGPKRKTQRARLPHNSLCRMGLQTNMKWLHAIRQDKRADREKTTAELAFSGGRISLTFRQIGTFLNKDQTVIWGQGAKSKSSENAGVIVNGTGSEAVSMIKAFGAENHMSNFDWDAYYGKGFDVLHMSSSPRLFTSSDPIVNMRLELMLAELGLEYAKGRQDPPKSKAPGSEASNVKFIDNDSAKSVVKGDIAIMLYLDGVYGLSAGGKATTDRASLARVYSHFQQAIELSRTAQLLIAENDKEKAGLETLRESLVEWDQLAAESGRDFLSDIRPALADFIVWPILHRLTSVYGDILFQGLEALRRYYDTYGALQRSKAD